MAISEEKPRSGRSPTGAGIAIGVAVGVALGAAFDPLALGVALGTAFGAAIDMVSRANRKKRS